MFGKNTKKKKELEDESIEDPLVSQNGRVRVWPDRIEVDLRPEDLGALGGHLVPWLVLPVGRVKASLTLTFGVAAEDRPLLRESIENARRPKPPMAGPLPVRGPMTPEEKKRGGRILTADDLIIKPSRQE